MNLIYSPIGETGHQIRHNVIGMAEYPQPPFAIGNTYVLRFKLGDPKQEDRKIYTNVFLKHQDDFICNPYDIIGLVNIQTFNKLGYTHTKINYYEKTSKVINYSQICQDDPNKIGLIDGESERNLVREMLPFSLRKKQLNSYNNNSYNYNTNRNNNNNNNNNSNINNNTSTTSTTSTTQNNNNTNSNNNNNDNDNDGILYEKDYDRLETLIQRHNYTCENIVVKLCSKEVMADKYQDTAPWKGTVWDGTGEGKTFHQATELHTHGFFVNIICFEKDKKEILDRIPIDSWIHLQKVKVNDYGGKQELKIQSFSEVKELPNTDKRVQRLKKNHNVRVNKYLMENSNSSLSLTKTLHNDKDVLPISRVHFLSKRMKQPMYFKIKAKIIDYYPPGLARQWVLMECTKCEHFLDLKRPQLTKFCDKCKQSDYLSIKLYSKFLLDDGSGDPLQVFLYDSAFKFFDVPQCDTYAEMLVHLPHISDIMDHLTIDKPLLDFCIFSFTAPDGKTVYHITDTIFDTTYLTKLIAF